MQNVALLPLLHLLPLLDGCHDGLGQVIVAHRGRVPLPQVRRLPSHSPGRHHWAVGRGHLMPLDFRFSDVAHLGGEVGRVEAHGGHSPVGHALAGSGGGKTGVEQAVIGQTTVPIGKSVGRKDALVRGGGHRLWLQGRQVALLRPAVTLPQAEGARPHGVRIQLERGRLEGAMEGGVGVLWQVQVGFRSVVMATDTLLHDGRGLPLILHDNLRGKVQNKNRVTVKNVLS